MVDKERLEKLIDNGLKVLNTVKVSQYTPSFVNKGKFYSWRAQTLNYLENEIGIKNQYYITFYNEVNLNRESNTKSGIEILKTMVNDLENIHINGEKLEDVDEILIRLFNKFHKCVRELRNRYDNRQIIDIQDEYDVQDFLRVLLNLYFDDIRPEEYTPSYAGSSARVDFLLKNENIVIEVKKTRKSLRAKELGNQLIEDIAKYQTHPNCKKLFCFVYDPDGYISNPIGIEKDLSKEEGLPTKVVIRPEL